MLLAGSDLANGWAGFIDGAIESGLRAGAVGALGAVSDRREAIVEATLRLIDRRGADAVTHRAVAAEAGVPLASTTYHFASKAGARAGGVRAGDRTLDRRWWRRARPSTARSTAASWSIGCRCSSTPSAATRRRRWPPSSS